MAAPDPARLAVHTMTTKPWSLEQAIAGFQQAGIRGITVWRQHLEPYGAPRAGQMLKASGLGVAALCRGGFFPAVDAAGRQKAIDDNRRAVDEAAAIGAPMVVLVCGAVPGLPLEESRRQIADGIAAVLPHARACKVKLAIEPLHPCYAGDRSAVNTMAQARRICEQVVGDEALGTVDGAAVGIAADVYHVWWDDALRDELLLAGRKGYLHAFHLCDWKTTQSDMLNDRGLMGDGCIPLPTIRAWVEAAGFRGWNEVEVFSTRYWAGDMAAYCETIKAAYLAHA